MDFEQLVGWVSRAVDVAGVVAIAGGIAWVTLARIPNLRGGLDDQAYRSYRRSIGKAILLGLELLVAADIIRTVAVGPTLEDVLVLGLIVLVRTFLSLSLEVELEGRWPWRRGRDAATEPRVGPLPTGGPS